jgi:peptide/nickel transport system permease protein
VRVWLVRRLLLCVPTLIGITLVTFLLSRLAPGGPLSQLLDPAVAAKVSPDQIEALRHQLGLDRPLPEQYFDWLRRLATFDFGRSLAVGALPVGTRVLAALRVTFFLQLAGVLLMFGGGVPLGLWCATHAGRRRERIVSASLFALHSAPVLLLGTLLLKLFSVGPFGSLPMLGLHSPGAPESGLAAWIDLGRHALLPVVCVGLAGLPVVVQYTRAGVVEALSRPFLLAAAARGIPERRRVAVHALRIGILPLVTLLGQVVPYLVAGSVMVEWLFGLPGMGQLAAGAILERDYPVVMAISVVVGVAAMAGFLLSDLLYALLDRRVRVA